MLQLMVPILFSIVVVAQQTFQNTNNIYGRAKLRGDTCVIRYLGQKNTQADCAKACQAFESRAVTCKSWTWHEPDFEDPDWREGCYGVTDFSWQPRKESHVVSGRVKSFPKPGHCVSDAGCNYNGVCDLAQGNCRCNPQWHGMQCDELSLQPLNKSIPLGYHGTNTSNNDSKITSWGGSVVAGDDGLYHMYAAEIAGSCGMNVWLSNSRVIHATSADPATQPFKRQGVVAEVFAHEPIAARAPTGEYVVWSEMPTCSQRPSPI